MVASAGGTNRDLAAPQFRRNWGAVQYYSILNILKLKQQIFIIFYNFIVLNNNIYDINVLK
jgi:hypothetical protein